MIGVREAAERLGVSPRRVLQRIEDGSLAATRVGNQWVIDPAALSHASPRASRPLSPRMAWALLDHLDGTPTPAPLDRTERRRLARYADRLDTADDPVPILRAWLARRAQRLTYRVADADLADLRDDERIALAGVSLPAAFLVTPVTEAYVAASALDELVDDYLAVPSDVASANLVLHAVQDDGAGLPDPTRWPVLAADLVEHLGSRESARAVELVRSRGQ